MPKTAAKPAAKKRARKKKAVAPAAQTPSHFDAEFLAECEAWLADRFRGLTDELILLTPSEWAEVKRYLPPQVTPMPGYYSFGVAPYLREVLDCLSPHSPIRIVDLMKGVQVCVTVGILENAIGYYIDHVKNAPLMLLTADDGLAKLRMESYITPMLQYSGLSHLIKSADMINTRKTGKTDRKVEWEGGGFLIPFGAQNADKLRSTSVQILLEDETDAYPDKVGKDGDPAKLAEDRTAAYEATRKICRVSTPIITQTSRINREYLKGDQRKYFVPCRHCKKKQVLKFEGKNEDGTAYGLAYDLDKDGNLVESSVRYVCKFCGGEMVNDDKAWFLPRGEWKATATPQSPDRRSYHISALYSPVGMQTWVAVIRKWLDAWDVQAGRPKSLEALQQFYNNVLGLPFEMRGESLTLERVALHRRHVYSAGEIPNKRAAEETGGKVQVLTMAVDVHRTHLDVLINGYVSGGGFYSVLWLQLHGDCEDLDAEPWRRLRELIEDRTFQADDGRLYRPSLTLIDSQYNADLVYRFCSDYETGVFPIAGRDLPVKSAALREFSEFTSKLGTRAFNVTVSIYKDRLAAALRREWDGVRHQPAGHPNFPQDYPETFFKQLTAETKREKIDSRTGKRQGFVWYRPSGADNEAWDLCVYCAAALDMIAVETCLHRLGLDYVDWPKFWELCESEKLFFYG